MIRKEHRIEIADIARRNEVVLADAAFRIAYAVHALIPGSTAAVVVVGAGAEWRMLAQRGPERPFGLVAPPGCRDGSRGGVRARALLRPRAGVAVGADQRQARG